MVSTPEDRFHADIWRAMTSGLSTSPKVRARSERRVHEITVDLEDVTGAPALSSRVSHGVPIVPDLVRLSYRYQFDDQCWRAGAIVYGLARPDSLIKHWVNFGARDDWPEWLSELADAFHPERLGVRRGCR